MARYRRPLWIAGAGLVVAGVLSLVSDVSQPGRLRVSLEVFLGSFEGALLVLISLGFSVFPALAGAGLMRGSLRVAGWMEFFSAFYIGLSLAVVLAAYLVAGSPLAVVWPVVRSFPVDAVRGLVRWGAGPVLAAYVLYACRLARKGEKARGEEGGRPWAAWLGASLGVALVGASVLWVLSQVGGCLEQARAEALRKAGSGYRVFVYSVLCGERECLAKAIAYDSHEARRVEVEWEKARAAEGTGETGRTEESHGDR